MGINRGSGPKTTRGDQAGGRCPSLAHGDPSPASSCLSYAARPSGKTQVVPGRQCARECLVRFIASATMPNAIAVATVTAARVSHMGSSSAPRLGRNARPSVRFRTDRPIAAPAPLGTRCSVGGFPAPKRILERDHSHGSRGVGANGRPRLVLTAIAFGLPILSSAWARSSRFRYGSIDRMRK